MMVNPDRVSADSAPSGGQMFQVPPAVLLAGFAIVALGGFFDYAVGSLNFPIQEFHRYFCYAWLLALVVAENVSEWRRRLIFAGGCAAVFLVALFAVLFLPAVETPTGDGLFNAIISCVLLLAGIWLSAPIFLNKSQGDRIYRTAIAAFLVYGLWEFLSCATSVDPDASFYHFTKDRAFLFPLAVAWLNATDGNENLRLWSGRVVVWTMSVGVAAATVLIVANALAGEAFQDLLARHYLFFVEPATTVGDMPERRLNFPTMHFNRAAFWGMAAIGVFAASLFSPVNGRWKRIALMVCLPLALLMIGVSYTRGVLLATVGAVFLWTLLERRWKTAAAMMAAAAVLLVAIPDSARDHFLSAFRKETYLFQPGTPLTSMKSRFLAWQWGARQMRSHPLLGLGFSTRVTEQRYADFMEHEAAPDLRAAWRAKGEMVHTHNVLVETAVQSGLPALAALMLFMACRVLVLARAMGVAAGADRSRMAVWLALEAGLFVAGMVFYMLKKNFGFMFFFLWLWILLDARRTAAFADGKAH